MDNRKQRGRDGETVAAAFLEKNGVRILYCNFRSPFGEIDIIGKDGKYIIVVEVKRRLHNRLGTPAEAVRYPKQHKICKTFDYFRMQYRIDSFCSVRFDVVEVDGQMECHWIKNAFEYLE